MLLKKNIPLFIIGIMTLLILPVMASAQMTILEPVNGAYTNSSTQNINVQVLGRNGNANFTHLNLTVDNGLTNVTISLINVPNSSNASNANYSATWNAAAVADATVTIWALAYNNSVPGTVLIANMSNNISVTIDDTSPAVSTITPTDGIEDTSTITLTSSAAASCRWSLTATGFANMSSSNALTTSGANTSHTVASPLGTDKDQTFNFACQDSVQNQGATTSQRLLHRGTASVSAGTVAAITSTAPGSIGGGSAFSVVGDNVQSILRGEADSQTVLKYVAFLAIVLIGIWALYKAVA